MCKSVFLQVTSIILVSATFAMVSIKKSDIYLQERAKLLSDEKSNFFGQNQALTAKEMSVNKIILEAKSKELDAGYKNSSDFLPSAHFFQSKSKIDDSEVFKIIQKIPKGASLHTHMLAAASVDFIIENMTYLDHLYGGYINDVFKLKFMIDPKQDPRTNWTSIQDLRSQKGAEIFDRWLKEQLVLNVDKPKEAYPNPESVWKKFKKTFTTTYDFFSYKPVFQKYVYRLLQELYDDNVLYTEIKGTIMPLYDLDGTVYPKEEFFRFFIEVVDRFKNKHDGFVGVKYIHSIYRGVDDDVLRTGLEEIVLMKKLFPDFIAGFDFVGYEEEGKSLLEYLPELLEARKVLNFFFHAGETNWFGHTDLNLADAVLLNCSRIGHGFALTKHPTLLQLAKTRNIPLEICPISNQVLMLNEDPRNHPAATLMALDFPVVVANDDPSIWNATGLSYDWYIVFMAMTPRSSGIEVLKQLAVNSIVYSAMGEEEKKRSLVVWEERWEEFLEEVLKRG